jgi:transcription elongation factor
VLQVHEDYLKMINEQSKIVSVKVCDLGKKVPLPPRNGTLNGRDKNNNTLAMDQVVKVMEGPHRGMNGTIRHGHKHYIFLWNKEFVQSNGVFVVNSRNTQILGVEFLEKNSGEGLAVANQNRLLKDKLVGKFVFVTQGKFKGHRGRVTYADDR